MESSKLLSNKQRPKASPLHLLLEELLLLKGAHKFQRVPHFDRLDLVFSCDCAGFITLLLKELSLFPDSLPQNPRASDYFEYIETNGPIENIKEIKRHDVLCWKKQVIPKSGDSGHILMANRRPKKVTDELYNLEILEVTRSAQGISERIVELHTYKDGRIWGIGWDPLKKKVKKTKIIAKNIFKEKACLQCHHVLPLCLCNEFPKVKEIAPSIIVLRHPDESKHPLATLPLLERYFENLQVLEGNYFNEILGTLIYPKTNDSAVYTSQELIKLPLPLILIDASWKKSKRILFQNPWLEDLPRYEIKGLDSNYLLRKQIRPGALNTLETFVTCWKKLQPAQEKKQEKLMSIFHEFIKKKAQYIGQDRLESFYD